MHTHNARWKWTFLWRIVLDEGWLAVRLYGFDSSAQFLRPEATQLRASLAAVSLLNSQTPNARSRTTMTIAAMFARLLSSSGGLCGTDIVRLRYGSGARGI